MQQVEVTEADKVAVTEFHKKQIARIMAGDKTLGDNRDCIEQAFARHRIEATQAKDEEIARLKGALRHLRAFWKPGSDHDTQEVQYALANADALLGASNG